MLNIVYYEPLIFCESEEYPKVGTNEEKEACKIRANDKRLADPDKRSNLDRDCCRLVNLTRGHVLYLVPLKLQLK